MKTSLSILVILAVAAACSTAEKREDLDLLNAGVSGDRLTRISLSQYDTFVTFLSTPAIVNRDDKQSRIQKLQSSFRDFASGVGKKSLAIWLASPTAEAQVLLSKSIHDSYGLKYSAGPYLIISNAPPTAQKEGRGGYIALDFSELNADRIQAVLDELQQQIRIRSSDLTAVSVQYSKQVALSKIENIPAFARELAIDIVRGKATKN